MFLHVEKIDSNVQVTRESGKLRLGREGLLIEFAIVRQAKVRGKCNASEQLKDRAAPPRPNSIGRETFVVSAFGVPAGGVYLKESDLQSIMPAGDKSGVAERSFRFGAARFITGSEADGSARKRQRHSQLRSSRQS